MWLPPEQIMCPSHKETPCVVIVNIFLSLMKSEKGKAEQVLSGDWYRWEEGGGGEKVWESEYSEILCTHVCK
jgi:hypothetical protein